MATIGNCKKDIDNLTGSHTQLDSSQKVWHSREMAIDYTKPKWYPDAGDVTSISNEDIELAVEECLLNGRCDISIFLESSPHAAQIRNQLNAVVLSMTAEPIEILTFHWGFRLMRLRPTRPLSDLEDAAK